MVRAPLLRTGGLVGHIPFTGQFLGGLQYWGGSHGSQWFVSDCRPELLFSSQEQPRILRLCRVLDVVGLTLMGVNEWRHCLMGKTGIPAHFTLWHFQLTCKM